MAMAATTSSLPPRFNALRMIRHDHVPMDSHVRFRRSRGKRVTWASNDQLCQVRMFLAEDAPFLAGIAQEQLQVKTTSSMRLAEDLPPGFGGGGFGVAPVVSTAVSSCMKVDTEALIASVSAAIPWRCPSKFELDPQWLVEAGEASSEVESQKQRESTTLEAVYPRSSAIPTSPLEPDDQGYYVDDRQVLLIPVVAADEDSDGEESSAQGGPASVSVTPVGYGLYNQTAMMNETTMMMLGNNINNNNNKASTAYMNGSGSHLLPGDNNNNKGIDTSLLLQLLANPSLVETLSGLRNNSMVNTPNGNAANHLLVTPRNNQSPVTGSVSSSSSSQPALVRNLTSLTSSSASQSVVAPPPVVAWHQQHQQQSQSSSSSTSSAPPGFQHQYLNVNCQQAQQAQQAQQQGEQYYKELIMQHGRGVQVQQGGGGGNGYVTSNGVPPGFGLIQQAESKGSKPSSKPRKACAYYNTAKGCRNGSKCPFLHDGKRNGAELNHTNNNKRMRS